MTAEIGHVHTIIMFNGQDQQLVLATIHLKKMNPTSEYDDTFYLNLFMQQYYDNAMREIEDTLAITFFNTYLISVILDKSIILKHSLISNPRANQPVLEQYLMHFVDDENLSYLILPLPAACISENESESLSKHSVLKLPVTWIIQADTIRQLFRLLRLQNQSNHDAQMNNHDAKIHILEQNKNPSTDTGLQINAAVYKNTEAHSYKYKLDIIAINDTSYALTLVSV